MSIFRLVLLRFDGEFVGRNTRGVDFDDRVRGEDKFDVDCGGVGGDCGDVAHAGVEGSRLALDDEFASWDEGALGGLDVLGEFGDIFVVEVGGDGDAGVLADDAVGEVGLGELAMVGLDVEFGHPGDGVCFVAAGAGPGVVGDDFVG